VPRDRGSHGAVGRAPAVLSSTVEGFTAYVESDLRDISAILSEASRTLDFGAPIAPMRAWRR